VKTYKAGQPPQDPAQVPGFLRQELPAIEQAANRADPLAELIYLHAEPPRMRKGMLVLANGTNWNPGSGAGLYLRNEANDAWLFIISLSALLALANTWSEKQTFSNYTVLGAGPAIKMKKLTGTTDGAEGGITNVAHGLTQSKIISFQTLVTHSAAPDGSVPAGYTRNAGYEFNESLYDGGVSIENSATNSENILSKSFTVLITYEE
jgi:hypothetical protein